MYNEILSVLDLIAQYIENSMSKTFWDIFVEYDIPIIGVVVLVLSSIAAVTKYYIEKNRDLNEKILKGTSKNH